MAYCFERGESVSDGVRRLLREEIEGAAADLSDESVDRHHGVHEARKRLKKTRAVLRLVRGSLGEVFARQNARYRDIGRRLSRVRDAEAMVETADDLREDFPGATAGPNVIAFREALVRRRQRIADEEGGLDAEIGRIVRTLREAASDVGALDPGGADFDVLGPGLRRVYRRGRRALRLAYAKPTGENFHAWRKRVKDSWYHAILLREVWPEVMDGTILSLDRLSSLLGDEHDLHVFRALLETEGGDLGDPVTVRRLRALAGCRQDGMRAEARPIGRRCFAERPGAFEARLRAWWAAWR